MHESIPLLLLPYLAPSSRYPPYLTYLPWVDIFSLVLLSSRCRSVFFLSFSFPPLPFPMHAEENTLHLFGCFVSSPDLWIHHVLVESISATGLHRRRFTIEDLEWSATCILCLMGWEGRDYPLPRFGLARLGISSVNALGVPSSSQCSCVDRRELGLSLGKVQFLSSSQGHHGLSDAAC